MKKGLPKFLLLTDPYDGLEGRLLVLRTQYPRFIYELNRNDDDGASIVKMGDSEYRISVRRDLDNVQEVKSEYLEEVGRWYHYSLIQ